MSDESQGPKRRIAPQGPSLPPHLQRSAKAPRADDESHSRRPQAITKESRSDRESWMTEKPENKMKADPTNLKNRQFISKRAPEFTGKQKSMQERQEEERQAALVDEYNREYRPKPLAEIHKKDEGKETMAVDAPNDSRFDWERDMKQGTRGGSSKDTSDLLNRIGKINSRFSSGSSTKRFL